MRYKTEHIILVIFLSLFSLSLGAQSRDGARKQMNQGNYSNAITLLSALEDLYPGQYTSDLKIANQCLQLQRSAKSSFKSQRYSEAESLYNQLLKLNPYDKNAQQAIIQCQEERNKFWAAEYAKCKSIADFRAFAQRYPTAPQTQMAKSRIEEYELTQNDNNAWNTAFNTGSVASYTTYISKANSKAAHLGEAYRNRARLQYNEAVSSKTERYRQMNYSSARKDYDSAKKHGVSLWNDDNNKYNVCLAEEKFYSLGTSPAVYSVTSYINWASSLQSNSVVAPHLHLDKAYSMLVESYCQSGRFDEARNTVEQCYGQMTSSYFIADSGKEWSKSEWKTYIKHREKLYKKNLKKTNSSQKQSMSRNAYKYTAKKTYPFQISIPVVLDVGKRIRSIGGGVGIGGYGALFHTDVLAMYNVDIANTQQSSLLLKVEPVINFKRYASSDPFSDFHINAGPIVGYSTVYGFNGGAKVGVGLHYSDLSVSATWVQNFGWYIGFSFRIHLFHYTFRE